MKLTQWPDRQRPREKLLANGAASLNDAELLAIFLRTGIKGVNVVELSARLIAEFGSLHGLLSANKQRFCAAPGVGISKYIQLQAVMEMSKRYLAESLSVKTSIESAQDTRRFLMAELRGEPNEVFAAMFLDTQHRLISFEKVFFGTINCANVYPRVLVKRALDKNAAAIILAHNHPSGIAEPSQADKQVTERIVSALSLVDIRVLDHFVIGQGYSVSFAERGLI